MSDGRISVGIVDDEVLIAARLMHSLEGIGYVASALAHTFEDGMVLIDRLGERSLVFVDLFLDGRPAGIELAQRAAQNGLNVVVMTGATALPGQLPGAALLLKPFSPEQVQILVHSLRETSPAPTCAAPATRHPWPCLPISRSVTRGFAIAPAPRRQEPRKLPRGVTGRLCDALAKSGLADSRTAG